MMKTLLTLTVLVCIALAGSATGTQLMDFWNADEEPLDGSLFPYPANYGILYIPPADYNLELVEFFAGASDFLDDDQFTVQIMGDFDNQPDGVVLASATTPLVDGIDPAFLGTYFEEPLALVEGQKYWVCYYAMAWSHYSASVEGVDLTTMTSGDQIHWDPANPVKWMTKFWGYGGSVAVQNVTFGQIKSLYR